MKKLLTRLAAALLAVVLLAAPASALTVDEALELLEENYYFDIPDAAYEAQTLDELFRLLGDPYTYYMTEEQYSAFLDAVEGETDTVGVGVMVYFTEQGILVDEVVTGGSAQGADLRAGDLIVAIDGVSCVPADDSQLELMVGAEGTQVTVTVLRDGQTRDYTLTRRAIHIPNTEITLLEGGVGYVDCNSFGSDTGGLFLQGLKEYDSQVDYWLVDLRGNTGGYVDSAADMLAGINGPGRYLYFELNDGSVGSYVRYTEAATQKPLVVLVDGSSASASEALAAGVRDLNRGIIIGSRTFGKGIGQNILDEKNCPEYFSGDGLRVTTGRFYSPGGTTTDRIGVIPTLLVDNAYTEAVAAALTGGSEHNSRLCLVLGPTPLYVAPDTPDEVVAALLEAVSPQVPVFYSAAPGAASEPCTPAQAAEKLGIDYENRWFDDVADSPYANSINAMGTYRLLNGTDPGRFSPHERLTRAQLCVMLARVLNVSYNGPGKFTDVPEGAWYAKSVNAMKELGLVDGVGGGRFDPDSDLTQEEFLTIMGRTARYLNVALDAYGGAVEDAVDSLPADMVMGLSGYHDWAWSSVAVLAWGLEAAVGSHSDMLYTTLDRMTPPAPVLREEAAAGMYAVLAGLDILP